MNLETVSFVCRHGNFFYQEQTQLIISFDWIAELNNAILQGIRCGFSKCTLKTCQIKTINHNETIYKTTNTSHMIQSINLVAFTTIKI